MKYKAGDKVVVRSYESMKEEYGSYSNGSIPVTCTFINYMKPFCGKVVTISEVRSISYHINEDRGEFLWSDEMFEIPKNSIAVLLKGGNQNG